MKSKALTIFFLSIAIYANSLKNGFVYDDAFTVADKFFIEDLSNLPQLFDKAYFALSGELTYRPVVTFTYFLDYAMFGLNAWGFHLTNMLLHAINGVLLYTFLALLSKDSKDRNQIPLLASLLFVTHPALTEAVNAISFREDLLAFSFYMATLILYIGSTARSSPIIFLLSCVTYSVSLFSKEMAITLPLIVYLYERIYGRRGKGAGSILFNRYNAGYIAVTVVYLFFRFFYFQSPEGEEELHRWGLWERFMTIPVLILSYLKLIVFPVSLSAEYVILPVRLVSPTLLFSSIAVISLLAIAFMKGEKERGIAFGTGFFIATLLPVSNIIQLTNPFAMRYLYLPTAGLAIAAGVIISNIAGSQDAKIRRRSIFMLSLSILAIYSAAVVMRNEVWRSDYTLWSDTVRKAPDSGRAHLGLGLSYYEKNRLNDAVRHYQIALSLTPDYAKGHNNLSLVYYQQGRLDDALSELQTALRLKPNYAKAYYNTGRIYFTQGRIDEAMHAFRNALALQPDIVEAHYGLGLAYLKKGLKDEARKEFEMTLKLKPNHIDAYLAIESTFLD